MAYNGTTAGSTLSNPPMLIAEGGMGGKTLNNGSTVIGTAGGMGNQLWFYTSTDTSTSPLTANYFTDAATLGIQGGDVCIYVQATGSTVGLGLFVFAQPTTSGVAFLSTGSMITSTFG